MLRQLLDAGLLRPEPRGYSLRDPKLFRQWVEQTKALSSSFYYRQNERDDAQRLPEGTFKSWRAARSVGPEYISRALNLMKQWDADLKILFSLAEEPLVQNSGMPVARSLMRGVWMEFHPSQQGEKAVYAKAILIVNAPNDCHYYIDSPRIADGERLYYSGKFTVQPNSIVFHLKCRSEQFPEEVTFIYPFSSQGASRIDRLKGFSTGISFDSTPMGAKSVLKRLVLSDFNPHPPSSENDSVEERSNCPDLPSVLEYLGLDQPDPKKKSRATEILNDENAAGHLEDLYEFVQAGPNYTAIHPNWRKFDLLKIARSIPAGSTIKIISSYVSDTIHFKSAITQIREENIEINFQIIFMNPDSELFNARFRLLGMDEDCDTPSIELQSHKKLLKAQVAYLEKISSDNLKISVKYSKFWPVGVGYMIGDEVLYLGLMFATEAATKSSMIEVRDTRSLLWKHFARDFETIWQLANGGKTSSR